MKRGSSPEYTLEGASQPGAVLLKKDGAVVSMIQVVPSPVAGALLAADASGMHWESEQAHGTHGGTGGAGDAYIASIDIDTQVGASLGKITAITSLGVTVTSAQSTTDIHPTLTQHNTLSASVTFLTIQNAALSAVVSTLNTRVAALEAQRLTTKLDPGLSDLDVDQIAFDSGTFGKQYFSSTKTLRVYTGSLPTDTPY